MRLFAYLLCLTIVVTSILSGQARLDAFSSGSVHALDHSSGHHKALVAARRATTQATKFFKLNRLESDIDADATFHLQPRHPSEGVKGSRRDNYHDEDGRKGGDIHPRHGYLTERAPTDEEIDPVIDDLNQRIEPRGNDEKHDKDDKAHHHPDHPDKEMSNPSGSHGHTHPHIDGTLQGPFSGQCPTPHSSKERPNGETAV